MAVSGFHPILYVAEPYAERDFFIRFGFETFYEGDEFPGFLAVKLRLSPIWLSSSSRHKIHYRALQGSASSNTRPASHTSRAPTSRFGKVIVEIEAA